MSHQRRAGAAQFNSALLASGCNLLGRSDLVRRANIRERAEQVRVVPHVISSHLAVCEDGKKDINGVVSKCSAICRVGRRLAGIVRQDIRQKHLGSPLCCLRRISPRVLQRVREDIDETRIV